jgi:hypothetical protein
MPLIPQAELPALVYLSTGVALDQQGVDVDNAMVMLSTYVGHAKVTDTYWYLTGIPELMAIAAQRFEHFTEGVCHV